MFELYENRSTVGTLTPTIQKYSSINENTYLHSESLSAWHTIHQPVFLFHISETKKNLWVCIFHSFIAEFFMCYIPKDPTVLMEVM
jgi:hypothetical protein